MLKIKKIVNLCPHPVVVFGDYQLPIYDLPTSKNPARSVARNEFVANCVKRRVDRIGENIPDPEEGTLFVVSNSVRSNYPERKDFASPSGSVIRNGKAGCVHLVTN